MIGRGGRELGEWLVGLPGLEPWDLILIRDRPPSAVLSSVLPGRANPGTLQGWGEPESYCCDWPTPPGIRRCARSNPEHRSRAPRRWNPIVVPVVVPGTWRAAPLMRGPDHGRWQLRGVLRRHLPPPDATARPGDRGPGDAEELLQDAYGRAVVRWRRLRDYQAPEAWVRRVALRLATDRAGRARRRAAALLRLRPSRSPSVELSADSLDLYQALRGLPPRPAPGGGASPPGGVAGRGGRQPAQPAGGDGEVAAQPGPGGAGSSPGSRTGGGPP
jgi:hypothetical protein